MEESRMIYVKYLTTEDELNEMYKIRYKTFVLEDKNAPDYLYENNIMMDECDKRGMHIGCYWDSHLLGFLTVIIKNIEGVLPIEKVRWDCKNKQKQFAKQGCTVQILNNSLYR